MKKNVGHLDSRIRTRLGMILIIVGIIGLANLLTLGTAVSVILIVIGLVAFWTGQTRKCSVYELVNIDTRKQGSKEDQSGNHG